MSKPPLCPASYFHLIVAARKNRKIHINEQKYKYVNNSEDKLGDPNIMGGLIYVIEGLNPNPEGSPGSLSTDTSYFKTFQKTGSPCLPFDRGNHSSGARVDAFLTSFDVDYQTVLGRMADFCNDFLNIESKGVCHNLVRDMLCLVLSDETVTDEYSFHILGETGEPVLRSNLLSELQRNNMVRLEVVLLGILRWMLESGRKNDVAKDTYKTWYKKDGHSWVLKRDIVLSDGIKIDLTVERAEIENNTDTHETNDDQKEDGASDDFKEFTKQFSDEKKNVFVGIKAKNFSYVENIEHLESLFPKDDDNE